MWTNEGEKCRIKEPCAQMEEEVPRSGCIVAEAKTGAYEPTWSSARQADPQKRQDKFALRKWSEDCWAGLFFRSEIHCVQQNKSKQAMEETEEDEIKH